MQIHIYLLRFLTPRGIFAAVSGVRRRQPPPPPAERPSVPQQVDPSEGGPPSWCPGLMDDCELFSHWWLNIGYKWVHGVCIREYLISLIYAILFSRYILYFILGFSCRPFHQFRNNRLHLVDSSVHCITTCSVGLVLRGHGCSYRRACSFGWYWSSTRYADVACVAQYFLEPSPNQWRHLAWMKFN